MDSLAELIAKFDREHPEDMRIAREELKRRPLTSNDFSCVDITEVLLCHEITRLRAELAKANALLLTYGWHRDECAFLEVCDDCDCGFEAILRKALTINKAARKGEGE